MVHNSKQNIMKTIKLLTILFLSITVFSCSTNNSDEDLYGLDNEKELTNLLTCNKQNTNEIETAIYNAINAHRESVGKPSLCFEEVVVYTESQIHSEYMADKNASSHDNFNERAEIIFDELNAVGVAENVAVGVNQNPDNFNVNGLVQSWINSPSHKKNLEGDFTHTAVSFSISKEGNMFFTQLFVKL